MDLNKELSGTVKQLKDRYYYRVYKNQIRSDGGPGSGNFGHSGRPGQVGGSSDDGGESSSSTSKAPKLSKAETAVKNLQKDLGAKPHYKAYKEIMKRIKDGLKDIPKNTVLVTKNSVIKKVDDDTYNISDPSIQDSFDYDVDAEKAAHIFNNGGCVLMGKALKSPEELAQALTDKHDLFYSAEAATYSALLNAKPGTKIKKFLDTYELNYYGQYIHTHYNGNKTVIPTDELAEEIGGSDYWKVITDDGKELDYETMKKKKEASKKKSEAPKTTATKSTTAKKTEPAKKSEAEKTAAKETKKETPKPTTTKTASAPAKKTTSTPAQKPASTSSASKSASSTKSTAGQTASSKKQEKPVDPKKQKVIDQYNSWEDINPSKKFPADFNKSRGKIHKAIENYRNYDISIKGSFINSMRGVGKAVREELPKMPVGIKFKVCPSHNAVYEHIGNGKFQKYGIDGETYTCSIDELAGTFLSCAKSDNDISKFII